MKGYYLPIIKFNYPLFSENSPEENNFFTLLDNSFFPCLELIERLENDSVNYQITLILSSTFIFLISSKKIINSYNDYLLKKLSETTDNNLKNHYKNIIYLLNQKYNNDIVDAVKNLISFGKIKLATSTLTNPVLPFLLPVAETINPQLKVAVNYAEKIFDHKVDSLYIKANSYFPKIGQYTNKNKIKYLLVERDKNENSLINYPVEIAENIFLFINNNKINNKFDNILNSGNSENITALIEEFNKFLEDNHNINNSQNIPVFSLYINFINQNNINVIYQFLKLTSNAGLMEQCTPDTYFNNSNMVLNFEDTDWINSDVTELHQSGYQKLFPDLHIAALKLIEYINNKSKSNNILNIMAKELLLAQSFDYQKNLFSENNIHLNNFNKLVKNLKVDSYNHTVKSFLSDIDLVKYYQ